MSHCLLANNYYKQYSLYSYELCPQMLMCCFLAYADLKKKKMSNNKSTLCGGPNAVV